MNLEEKISKLKYQRMSKEYVNPELEDNIKAFRSEARKLTDDLLYGNEYFYYDGYIYNGKRKGCECSYYSAKLIKDSKLFSNQFNFINSQEDLDKYKSELEKTFDIELNMTLEDLKLILEENDGILELDEYNHIKLYVKDKDNWHIGTLSGWTGCTYGNSLDLISKNKNIEILNFIEDVRRKDIEE